MIGASMDLLIENSIDGTLLVLIPEGEFLAGSGRHDTEGGRVFPVYLPAYYLALYPVTNEQYGRFLNKVKPGESDLEEWIRMDEDCYVRPAGGRYEAYGGKQNHPVVNVSWNGARAYCQWAMLRLPGELEWEKGSRGTDGRAFPWGNEWNPYKYRNAKYRDDEIEDSETTCEVWKYDAGCSPWGLYQMLGNVSEWCKDRYDYMVYNRYERGDLTAPKKRDTLRIVRGGSWYDNESWGSSRMSCHYEALNNCIGFRCARDLQPFARRRNNRQ
jgi:formylglycine-generating enzyme